MRLAIAIGAAAVLAACADGDQRMAGAPDTNMSHLHIGHVLTSWWDTPDQMGLLPTPQAEAAAAAQHAGFAASRPGDLDWMKRHAGDVVHAVEPTVEAQGPGRGYGVRRAAQGAAQRVRFAAASEDASDKVKLHAGHVETSAGNVIARSERVVDLGQPVETASSAAAAARLVAAMQSLTQAILMGTEANRDGTVGWKEDAGGLARTAQHMQLMREGEGMA
jgi:hypothetical protein